MPTKPSLPEPYWLLKRSGHIKKCCECEEELKEDVIGRWDVDSCPKVDKQNSKKYWVPKVDA